MGQLAGESQGQRSGVGREGDRCDPGQEAQGPHGGLLPRKGAGSLEEEARMARKLLWLGLSLLRSQQDQGAVSAPPAWQEGQCSHGDLHSNGPESLHQCCGRMWEGRVWGLRGSLKVGRQAR